MKIGLIADTHVPSAELSPKVKQAFEGVDLILHAGDIFIPSCLDWLEGIAPVKAVELGSVNQFAGDSRVSEHTRVVEVEGHNIGMVHELALPGMSALEVLPGVIDKSFPPNASLPDALKQVFDRPVDIVVFGFSHETVVEEHDGILFINPGSATWPSQKMKPGTVGILDLTPGSRDVRIVDLSELS
ncbi:MAG: metallophosphoesterase family protein [Chloroflexota bacterium]